MNIDKIIKIFTNIMLFVFLLLILVLPLFSVGIMKLESNENILGAQNQNINSRLIERIKELELENRILRERLQNLETATVE